MKIDKIENGYTVEIEEKIEEKEEGFNWDNYVTKTFAFDSWSSVLEWMKDKEANV